MNILIQKLNRPAIIEAVIAMMDARGNTPTRFNLPFEQHEVEKMLTKAYISVVAEDGRAFVDDDHTADIISRVAKWLTSPEKLPNLLLYGGMGNGKTTMVRAVARLFDYIRGYADFEIKSAPWRTTKNEDSCVGKEWEILQRMPKVKFISALELVEQVRADDVFLRELGKIHFLAIDDFGCEPNIVKVYGTDLTPISDIICHRNKLRYEFMTIITTNLDLSDICSRYGQRIADIIQWEYERIAYMGESYRSMSTNGRDGLVGGMK